MNINGYISELLFSHECVILPGLGGFVTNYKSAHIQNVQNTFYPPSKSISFNKNLTNNDGLLANYIVQKENISYNIACSHIDRFTAELNTTLRNKKQYKLSNVGTLSLNTENQIQFEPDITVNYLLESYGLTVFQKDPIKRVSIEEKITKEFKDRTAPVVAIREKKSSKKWVVAAAITIPLAFFAIWIPSKYDLNSDFNYANLNPFKPDPKEVYQPKENTFVLIESDEKNIKQQIIEAENDTYFLTVKMNEASFVVKLKERPVAEAVTTYVETNTQELHYHIVGGCFSSKRNAKKMVKKLQKDGFNASIIGKRKGLWTVSYNSFATRKEAVRALTDAKSHNGKAWVLNY